MRHRLVLFIGVCLILGLVVVLLTWFVCGPSGQTSAPLGAGPEPYSFYVAGHTYGEPGVDNEGVHPPFKASFPAINAQGPDFGMFTGDIVISGTPANWDEIDADLGELGAPVRFAVGTHDLGDRSLFESRYGPTYYSFEHRGDLFIVLDGEADHCNVIEDQLAFLETTLSDSDARHVFVFVHKLIWVAEGTPYFGLTSSLNTTERYDFQNNFWSDVEPLLRELDAEVYVVAGDVGVTWAMPLFYEQDGNIHFIASGMGGAEEENYLTFQVSEDGVEIKAQRLDGQPLSLGWIEAYDLAHYLGE